MRRNYFVLLIILIFTSLTFAFEYGLFEVDNIISEDLFTSFGTRTKNVQILDLTYENSSDTILIIKGWWFSPIDIPVVKDTDLRLFAGESEVASFKIPLSRSTMYRSVEPLLIVIPSRITDLELLDVSIHLTNKNEEGGELKFEILSYNGRYMEKSVFAGKVVADTFLETRQFSKNDNPVIVIAAGSKPTGGYSISITSVKLSERIIEIEAALTAPSKDAFVTQAFTFPSSAIILEKLVPGIYQIQVKLITHQDEKFVDEEFLTTSFEIK